MGSVQKSDRLPPSYCAALGGDPLAVLEEVDLGLAQRLPLSAGGVGLVLESDVGGDGSLPGGGIEGLAGACGYQLAGESL